MLYAETPPLFSHLYFSGGNPTFDLYTWGAKQEHPKIQHVNILKRILECPN